MAKKQRLIDILAESYPDISRKELYASVMCGEFRVDGHTVKDPLQVFPPGSAIIRRPGEFVSRGGLKLDHALSAWGIDVTGSTFLDAGCSTGGFTHCLLLHGAGTVHAVDVGYNQLDWKLRSDRRVIVHERVNIMDLTSLEPVPDAAVADLSFRSLRRAVAHIFSLTAGRWCIALIKPQFELGYTEESFDGVLRDKTRLAAVVSDLLSDLRTEGVYGERLLRSPIRGSKGNIEFLVLFRDHETGTPGELRKNIEQQLLSC